MTFKPIRHITYLTEKDKASQSLSVLKGFLMGLRITIGNEDYIMDDYSIYKIFNSYNSDMEKIGETKIVVDGLSLITHIDQVITKDEMAILITNIGLNTTNWAKFKKGE